MRRTGAYPVSASHWRGAVRLAAPTRRRQVLKRLPNLKKLDGIPVDVDERDQAMQARGNA